MKINIVKNVLVNYNVAYVIKESPDNYTVVSREDINAFQAMDLVSQFIKKENDNRENSSRQTTHENS